MESLRLHRPLINHLCGQRARLQFPAVPAYTMTARVLHWVTAFFILLMIPLGVIIANEWGGAQKDLLLTCTGRSGLCSFRFSFCG
jgi:hypothetical protein